MRDGGPAFPITSATFNADAPDSFEQFKAATSQSQGMSLRDYFAAAALQKCQSVVFEVGPKEGKSTTARIASICYEQADAMLAEREKP